MKKIIISFVLCFAMILSLKSQSQQIKDTIADKHHVIILIDRSAGMIFPNGENTSNFITRNNVSKLKNVLNEVEKLCNQPVHKTKGRKILQNGDYLSFAGFGLHYNESYYDKDFKKFILRDDKYSQNRRGDNHKFGYRFLHISKPISTIFEKIKNNIFNKGNFFNKYWGGISVSRALGITAFREPDKTIGRTFLFLITDGEYNGSGDPMQEVMDIKNIYESKGKTLDISFALKNINLLNENYLCKSVNEYNPVVYKENKSGGGKFYLSLYEYIPLQKFFSIESVFHFPSQIVCNRVPYGYKAKIDLSPIDNPYYTPIQILGEMHCVKKDTIIDAFNYTYTSTIQLVSQELNIDNKYAFSTDSLKLKFWLHFNDEAYGASVLSPNGSNLQGAKGLNRVLPVEFEPTVKIFGVIPLSDAMFKLFSFSKGQTQERTKDIIHLAGGIVVLILLTLMLFGYILVGRRHTKRGKEKE